MNTKFQILISLSSEIDKSKINYIDEVVERKLKLKDKQIFNHI